MSDLAFRGLFAAMFAMCTVTSALSHVRQDRYLPYGARVPRCKRYSVDFIYVARSLLVGHV
eukprot:595618-Alexandrium_andersonii.AAC.1